MLHRPFGAIKKKISALLLLTSNVTENVNIHKMDAHVKRCLASPIAPLQSLLPAVSPTSAIASWA
jgi:hypothetical protein